MRLLYVLLFVSLIAACSPRTTVITRPPEKQPEVVVVTPPKAEPPPPVKKHVNTIALILPFQLDKITTRTIRQADISRSALALDFYQGFKLALDSLASKGNDFKLQVLDSRDNASQAAALARSSAVQTSDIVIGPVVPDGIKAFGTAADLSNKLQVSPLAAAMPDQFNNPKLVTMNNSIEQHAWKLVDFISKRYPPSTINIIIVNTRKTADEQFTAPIRKYFNNLKSRFVFTEVSGLTGIESKLSRSKTNLIILTSPDRDFVAASVSTLYNLSQTTYNNIELYGHPNWARADLDVTKLEGLDTRFTSSYYVDNISTEVLRFITRYRRLYRQTPSEYAFKGFDTGYLFGNMLVKYGPDYIKHMSAERYYGLHNDFQFSYDPASGYINNNLMMLKYSGYELRAEP